MAHIPGRFVRPDLSFEVSEDHRPAQHVSAASAFDAAVQAIERGAQRVEVQFTEAELVQADLRGNELKNTGEVQRRRDDAAGLSFHERQLRGDLPA